MSESQASGRIGKLEARTPTSDDGFVNDGTDLMGDETSTNSDELAEQPPAKRGKCRIKLTKQGSSASRSTQLLS